MHLKAKWANTENGVAVRVFFKQSGMENLSPAVEPTKKVLYENRGAVNLLSERGEDASIANKLRIWPFGNWVAEDLDIEEDSIEDSSRRFNKGEYAEGDEFECPGMRVRVTMEGVGADKEFD